MEEGREWSERDEGDLEKEDGGSYVEVIEREQVKS
jgi:hypothetical protein